MTRQYTNEFKAQVLKEVQEVGNAALVYIPVRKDQCHGETGPL